MILLELGLLVKADKLSQKSIDFKEAEIKFEVLEELLNDFEKLYGSNFANLLSRMLQEDPEQRVTID